MSFLIIFRSFDILNFLFFIKFAPTLTPTLSLTLTLTLTLTRSATEDEVRRAIVDAGEDPGF